MVAVRMTLHHRVERLRATLADAQLPGLIISSSGNRRYLSGFTGSDGALLLTMDRQWLIADFRYWEQAADQAPAWELVKVQRALHIPASIVQLARSSGVTSLGFESEHTTVATLGRWEAASAGAVRFVPVGGMIEPLRARKDQHELAAIRRAVDITDEAYAAMRSWICAGMTERDVAWRLERYLREHGADGLAFDIIVASGPNAALPHHRPSDRAIAASEPVVVDMGAWVDGYCGDLTRTFCLPPVPDRLRRVHSIVLEALRTVERRIHAGMTGKIADALARDVIAEFGFQEEFGHSLGHSLGLDIHEWPPISPQSEEALPPGVVETIEPGIYLPGWGGVRIEDVVIVGEHGAEVLTRADKSLDWSGT